MKVFVTGSAGYVGSVLVPELLAAGHEVIGLDILRYGQPEPPAHARARFHRGDAADPATVAGLLAGADAVIPLAGIVGAPACDRFPAESRAINRDAALMLFSKLSPSQRLLIPATNSGYGGAGGAVCTEETPLRPVSEYARQKIEVELAALERENTLSFRLATAFGMSPRMRLDLLVNDFCEHAARRRPLQLFEPGFRRCFLHVRDIARLFVFALERFDSLRTDRIFNAGLSESNLTKLELCERIRALEPGFEYRISSAGKDPDQRDYLVSNARLEAAGFRTRTTLDEGLRELLAGLRAIPTGAAPLRNA